jgi:hypothetical protein
MLRLSRGLLASGVRAGPRADRVVQAGKGGASASRVSACVLQCISSPNSKLSTGGVLNCFARILERRTTEASQWATLAIDAATVANRTRLNTTEIMARLYFHDSLQWLLINNSSLTHQPIHVTGDMSSCLAHRA